MRDTSDVSTADSLLINVSAQRFAKNHYAHIVHVGKDK